MTKEASNIPADVLHAAHGEMQRGVDPAVLEEMGYFVPETSELHFDDAARAMVEARTLHSPDGLHISEDPELDEAWQAQRATTAPSVGRTATGRRLTSAEQNATARRREAEHYRRAQGWRQIRRGRS